MTARTVAAEEDGRGMQVGRAQQGLRELILAGDLPPGKRVSEPAMVDRLGVSRTPVRLALERLAREGLVTPGASGGFVVRAFTAADLADGIEVRGTLEGLAARLAAERRPTAADLAPLRACVADLDRVVAPPTLSEADFDAYVRLNAFFHEELVRLAGSGVVARAIEQASAQPFAGPSAFVRLHATEPAGRDTLVVAQEQHRLLLDAITRGQGARAEALAAEHARVAQRRLGAALADRDRLDGLPGGSLLRLAAGKRA
ncbi:GntR family transcriptional regulator [Nitrospirillum pindoramense]|uniref:GntR family transcriptional regulator of vanillate catabolism n=1 Tax=Nitrospirillum amazonense TaxID=28077 RepID=A0A560GR62_9PROT|nr:GntR family transcriptional regulator [Nitrospirillum amazonense]TWB36517.1 GntR family transcriptional regulator of vanillate catabolism [Nitrospirillum amazonense]